MPLPRSLKITNDLSWHGKLTYCAHMFKALVRQHHLELLPLLKKHIPKNGIIIDVGAHAGQFTKLFAMAAPKGHVYSFEPGSYARSIVSKVIALRNLKNVSLSALGLSDNPSEEMLHMPIKHSGSAGFGLSHIGQVPMDMQREAHHEKITLTTLDRFVEAEGIKRVDFIKADIEGCEMRFLLGARKTIEEFKPVIFLEINDAFLKRSGNSAEEVWNFLKSMGYHIRSLEEHSAILTDISSVITKGDVWCVHEKFINRRNIINK